MKWTGTWFVVFGLAQPIIGQTWLSLDQGIGGCLSGHHIHSLYHDNTTDLLHVTGTFSADPDCNIMRGFAIWNGVEFDSIANNNSSVQCQIQINYQGEIYGSTLFFVEFETYFGLGILQDGAWIPLENSPNSLVECAYQFDDILYLGGAFDECEAQPCYMVCTFDGQTFTPLISEGFVEDGWRMLDLTVYQGQLIAGGHFELLAEDGQSVWHLGVVSDGWIQPFQPPMTAGSIVEALQVWGDDLYIAGLLTPDGATNYRSIVKWDGTSYSDLSSYDYGEIHGPVNERITDMEVHDGKLYIAGWFDQLEGQPCQGVARWDGSEWECLNTEPIWPLWSAISDLEIIEDTLYLAGDFITIGTDTLHCIAKLNQALSGTDEYSLPPAISIFPNPFSDFIQIQSSESISQISIMDIAGQEIYSVFLHTIQSRLDLQKLSTGCYLLTIAYENGKTVTVKLLKM